MLYFKAMYIYRQAIYPLMPIRLIYVLTTEADRQTY